MHGDNILKILVIFTGGTIGSHISDGYISTDQKAPYKLLSMYKSISKNDCEDIEFIEFEPYCILSENLNTEHLSMLINHLRNEIKLHPDISGVIITHGTDTIQYAAAMLSYCFADSKLPILLVSSAYILDDPKANGLINFAAAIRFIKEKSGFGVFVSYSNNEKEVLFHHGTRLDTPSTCSSSMRSVMDAYYAKTSITDKSTLSFSNINIKNNLQIESLQTFFPNPTEDCQLISRPSILRLHIYPGIQYPELSDVAPKAILLESYHSGTVCADTMFISFANTAHEMNIPLFLIGAGANNIEYVTARVYKDLHITALPPSSPIAQFCKLWLALSINADIPKIMSCSYAHDHIMP